MGTKKQTQAMLAAAGMLLATAAQAQTGAIYPGVVPSNVAQLSGEGSVDVQQDVLRITMSTTKQGADANTVQTQLKQALDAALLVAKPQAKAEAMDVQTGNFSMYPNRDRNGKITNWQGTADLVLSGKDLSRISAVAGKISTLTIADVGFDISKELRRKTEAEAQSLAIADFKSKADVIARNFGFSGYSLREVSVNADSTYGGTQRWAPMKASRAADEGAPLSVEPGKTTVRVTVNGSVQMK